MRFLSADRQFGLGWTVVGIGVALVVAVAALVRPYVRPEWETPLFGLAGSVVVIGVLIALWPRRPEPIPEEHRVEHQKTRDHIAEVIVPAVRGLIQPRGPVIKLSLPPGTPVPCVEPSDRSRERCRLRIENIGGTGVLRVFLTITKSSDTLFLLEGKHPIWWDSATPSRMLMNGEQGDVILAYIDRSAADHTVQGVTLLGWDLDIPQAVWAVGALGAEWFVEFEVQILADPAMEYANYPYPFRLDANGLSQIKDDVYVETGDDSLDAKAKRERAIVRGDNLHMVDPRDEARHRKAIREAEIAVEAEVERRKERADILRQLNVFCETGDIITRRGLNPNPPPLTDWKSDAKAWRDTVSVFLATHLHADLQAFKDGEMIRSAISLDVQIAPHNELFPSQHFIAACGHLAALRQIRDRYAAQ